MAGKPRSSAREIRVLAVGSSPSPKAVAGFSEAVVVLEADTPADARSELPSVDCVLCEWADTGPVLELLAASADADVPTVACVADDGAARAALEAGATEVYRERGDPDPTVLERRIRAATAVLGPDGGESAGATLGDVRQGYVAVDADLTVTYADSGAATLLGTELTAGDDLGTAFPGGIGAIASAVEAGRIASFDRRGDGGGSLSVSVYPAGDGGSVYLREIPDGDARADTERLVESIPDAALVLDAQGVVLGVNDELLATTGREAADVVGDPVSTLFDEEGERTVAATLPDADGESREGGPIRTTLVGADGESIPCDLSVRRIHGDDAGRSLAVVRDLGEGTLRERRLRRLVTATRELMAAESGEAVMEVATAAAEDLGFEGGEFHRYDGRTDVLEPVANGGDPVSGGTSFPVRGMPQGRALRSGSVVVEDGDGRACRIHVPVGDHGVLSADVPGGEFDDTDQQLVQLLAASAEAALDGADRRERLLWYEAVVERVSGMVFALDEADRFTLVAAPLADRLGYDREELLGRSVATVLDAEDYDSVAPLSGTLQTAEDPRTCFETTVIAGDGSRIPVELSVSLLRRSGGGVRGTVGMVRDISDLERARERLSDERDRFTYLFENLPDAVAEVEFVDGEGYVRSVNNRFESTFAPESETIAGEPIDEFVLPPGLREEGKRINERAAAGEVIESSVRRLSVDGTRHFLLRVVPYDRSPDRTRSFAIYTDITEQKQRERYLRVVNRILRHNLRNDLNLVRGYAEHLVEELTDPALGEYADRIRDTVDHITVQSETAREVQDTIQYDDDGPAPVDLAAVVEEVVERYAGQYADADVSAAVPASAHIRAGEKVPLVVENLVENAIVHNTGEDPTVRATVTIEDDLVELLVEDDGSGIPDAERAVITEDREITQLEHGSGLGLWVVKWVVENYGGRVEFGDGHLGGAAVRVCFHRIES